MQIQKNQPNLVEILKFPQYSSHKGDILGVLYGTPYGNAQYMREGDTWSTSQRTEDLRSYASMAELFSKHDINRSRFHCFHEITR